MNDTVSNVSGPSTALQRNQRFEQLVNTHQASILRLCYLTLRDKTLAEDAVQETFLKVYRTMDTFRSECSEKTWIAKIAVHTCLDLNRSGWFRFVNHRVTPDMLPEAAVALEENDEELTLAVMRLPFKLRQVILLYYYQNFSVNEIADALHLAQSSVSGRLKRGRDKLKRALERSGSDA